MLEASHRWETIFYEWRAVEPSRHHGVSIFSEECVAPMTVDKDVVDHPKIPPQVFISHFCVYDAAGRTYSCSSWGLSYLWWRSWKKETTLIKIVLMDFT